MRVFGPGARELLHSVDETGSLSQGAKKMGVSYSKAWRMVGEIERGLGVILLERQTGGVVGGGSRLTAEGRLLLERFDAFMQFFEIIRPARLNARKANGGRSVNAVGFFFGQQRAKRRRH